MYLHWNELRVPVSLSRLCVLLAACFLPVQLAGQQTDSLFRLGTHTRVHRANKANKTRERSLRVVTYVRFNDVSSPLCPGAPYIAFRPLLLAPAPICSAFELSNRRTRSFLFFSFQRCNCKNGRNDRLQIFCSNFVDFHRRVFQPSKFSFLFISLIANYCSFKCVTFTLLLRSILANKNTRYGWSMRTKERDPQSAVSLPPPFMRAIPTCLNPLDLERCSKKKHERCRDSSKLPLYYLLITVPSPATEIPLTGNFFPSVRSKR